MAKVLLIGSKTETGLLVHGLFGKDNALTSVESLKDAIPLLAQADYEIIFLESHPPSGHFEDLKALAEKRRIPLVFLSPAEKPPAQNDWVAVGDLRFHLPSMSVTVSIPGGQKRLDVTALEFRLLHYLASHEETVLSRDQLLKKIWGKSVHVLDRAVDGHMSALRRKLRDSAYTVRAVYGQGYSFVPKSRSAARRAA